MFRRRMDAAPTGRYLTPLSAKGIKAGMISALKITADKIALFGVARFMTLSVSRTG